MITSALFMCFLLPLVSCLDEPTITPMSPNGVRFVIKDMGYSLVALHYSVNKKVAGIAAGDYNVDISTRQGDTWIHENKAITIHPGDFIDYWVYVTLNGQGQQLLNKEWRMTAVATPQPTHHVHHETPTPTTEAPVHHKIPTPTTDEAVHHVDHGNKGTETPVVNPHQPTSQNQNTNTKSCTSYPCLVFEDNFDFINHHVWQHELTLGGGGNWEFEQYTNNRSNSYCKNGILYIKPTLTTDGYGDSFLESGSLDVWGGGPHDTCTGNAFYGCKRDGAPGRVINPIQSARLRSSRGFNFKYGKVEVEAKLPTGDWIWPAIWMMPKYDVYGMWPASGEMDIMESRGNVNYRDNKGQPAGVDHIGSTLHFGPNWLHDAWPKTTASKNLHAGTYGDKFYKYGVEWDTDAIKFTVNGEEILNVAPGDEGFWKYGGFDKLHMENPWRHGTKMAPFDQEFFVILNVAVGGINYFPDTNTGPRPKPWHDSDKFIATEFWRAKNQWYPTWNPHANDGEDAALQINYVKVWKMKE